MAVRQARYEVWVRDPTTGLVQHTLTDWEDLTYTRRLGARSAFTLRISDYNATVRSYFVKDALIEIYRQIPGRSQVLEFTGKVRTKRQQFTDRRVLEIRGWDLLDFLASRGIAYYAGTKYTEKRGPAETVMKAFVNENAGPGALAPPRLRSGVTTGLSVQANGGTGATWEGARAHVNLLSVIAGIWLDVGTPEFQVVKTGDVTFEFQTPTRIGSDRTSPAVSGALNAAGNVPMTFALDFGNMENPDLLFAGDDEQTVLFVLGQGEGTDRNVVVATDSTAIAQSPWNAREGFIQATQEETIAALNSRARKGLVESVAKNAFSFTPIQTDGSQYGVDYFFGDTVSAVYDDTVFQLRIIGVTTTLGGDGAERLDFTIAPVGTAVGID